MPIPSPATAPQPFEPETTFPIAATPAAPRLPLPRGEWLLAALATLALGGLRWLYARNYPWNDDEPQHLHIVWTWAHGHLPYRDVFDNHTPLFHLLFAPLFRLLGERADIVQWMRLAMVPLFAGSLWCTYRLARAGSGVRAAVVTAFLLAWWQKYFFKMGEFRTDVLWTALWLLGLVVITSGLPWRRRLFWGGLVFGAGLAVSLKTVFLLAVVLVAAGVTWLFRRRLPVRGDSAGASGAALAVAGLVLIPAALLIFFATHGAWSQMVYCLITHNTMPEAGSAAGLWGRALSWHTLGVVPTLGLGLLLRPGLRAEPARVSRQLFILLVAGFYVPLLQVLWPTVTTQDYLPWFPVLFAALLPPFLDWADRLPAAVPRFVPRLVLPLLLGGPEVYWVLSSHPPLRCETAQSTAEIGSVLRLTQPGEYVMDAKGDCIYRPRPYYYVLESFTRRRLMLNLMPDELVQCLIDKGTAVVLESPRMTPRARAFVQANYRLIGPHLAVLGQDLPAAQGGVAAFTLAIPQEYSIISPSGPVLGTLDGVALSGSRRLSAGPHEFRPAAPSQPATLLWTRALEKGFQPYPSPAPRS